jgi:hypothetical protein
MNENKTLKDQLKKYWHEEPLAVIGTAVAVAVGIAKVTEALAGAQSKRAYAKQINRKK